MQRGTRFSLLSGEFPWGREVHLSMHTFTESLDAISLLPVLCKDYAPCWGCGVEQARPLTVCSGAGRDKRAEKWLSLDNGKCFGADKQGDQIHSS